MDIKDFIKEGKSLEVVEKEEQSKETKIRKDPIYETILENDSDFVLERKTEKTDKMLVCILSQGLLYFKNAKTGELSNTPTVKEVTNFIKECPRAKLPTKLKYNIRSSSYVTQLSDYFIWAMKNLQSAKELVNKKVFINPTSPSMKNRFDNITPEQIDTLVYASNLFDKVKPPNSWHSNEQGVSTLYDFITALGKVGINKDKLTYNLDKLLQIKYPFLDFNNRHNYIIQAIRIGNLEFNNFVDYMQRLNTKEMLKIFNGGCSYGYCFDLGEYKDYLDMQLQMYGYIKEKYPDNWLTSLQIMKAKFNAWKELHKDERFLSNVNKLKPLEYSDNKYCIIIPTKASDVVDEGAHLGHCVGSYVNRIVNGETNILFMRKVSEPEESLVTLEFKDNTLCQYKGYGDRPVTEEEDEFLTKWCKEKNIEKSERG